MMRYLLDTNMISEVIKKPNGIVARRLKRKKPGSVGVNSIVVSELYFGVRLKDSAVLKTRVDRLLSCLVVKDLPSSIATTYGEIRLKLQKEGKLIGPHDLLIAAHALQQRWIVVTRNEDEFRRITRLKVENWLKS